ncbi:hypothetical protein HPG69_008417 [Diceros bicornis minor]|uniref:Tektin n=1 Tax=Diceros bicornis minor TaxID=77932 RepID=A0A7J7FHS2_DICBM|nr:hypothetical protein HPG69_008417 [Diceros bicornis minor]
MGEHLGQDPSPGFPAFESWASPPRLTPPSPKPHRLVSEVEQLNASLVALREKLLEAEQSLRNLEDTRMSLEKDIAVQTNSLFIDRQKCMAHRARYPAVLQLAGYQ